MYKSLLGVITICGLCLWISSVIVLGTKTPKNLFQKEWDSFYSSYPSKCIHINTTYISTYNNFNDTTTIITVKTNIGNTFKILFNGTIPQSQQCFVSKDNSAVWLGAKPDFSSQTTDRFILYIIMLIGMTCSLFIIPLILCHLNDFEKERLKQEKEKLIGKVCFHL